MVPELCNGICSEIKYQFFLDTLIALGTILMAGVAIGAANSWRAQKKNELAREILEFVVRAHDVANLTLIAMNEITKYNDNKLHFEALYKRQKEKLDAIKMATDKAQLARIVLNDNNLYNEILFMLKQFALISAHLNTLSGPSLMVNPIQNDPIHKKAAMDVEHLYKTLIQQEELISAREICIEHLKRHIHYGM